MPTYSWADDHHIWDVSTTVATRDEPSNCPKCGAPGTRQLTLPSIDKTAAGGWNQQSFNPGLGCWTMSNKHAEQIAKSRGLEPIGDEPVEKLHKHYDNARKEKRERVWADDRIKVFD